MDWTRRAIEANRKALLRIVAGLVVMLNGLSATVMTRREHLAVLAELRPAESALRRLIAILADGMTVTVGKRRTLPVGGIPKGKGTGERSPVFALFDPRKRVGPFVKRVSGYGPNIRDFDGGSAPIPVVPEPSPDDLVDAQRTCRRVQALQAALDDPHAQARRLARMLASGRTKYKRVMRPGRPPGHREPPSGVRWWYPVDEILADCQDLALYALARDGPGTAA